MNAATVKKTAGLAWFPPALETHFERLGLKPPPDVLTESWKALYKPWAKWLADAAITAEEFDAASLRMQEDGATAAYSLAGRRGVGRWFDNHLGVLQKYLALIRGATGSDCGYHEKFEASLAASEGCPDPTCSEGVCHRYSRLPHTRRTRSGVQVIEPPGTRYGFLCSCPAGRWRARKASESSAPAPYHDLLDHEFLIGSFDPEKGFWNEYMEPPPVELSEVATAAVARIHPAGVGRIRPIGESVRMPDVPAALDEDGFWAALYPIESARAAFLALAEPDREEVFRRAAAGRAPAELARLIRAAERLPSEPATLPMRTA